MNTTSHKPALLVPKCRAELASLLAGVSAGLASCDERLIWLAWVSLVPIGWVWFDRARQTPTMGAIFAGGLIYHGLALTWLRTCYSDGTEWFGPRASAWVIISLLCASLFVAMWYYGQYLVRQMRWPVAIALPIAWVSMEFTKQFAGLIFVQMEFPWTKLGLTQASWIQIAQVADLGGELSLSFLICTANGAIVDIIGLIRGKSLLPTRRLICGVLTGSILLLFTGGYGNWRINQSTGEPGPIVSLMGEMDLPPFLDADQVPSLAVSAPKPDLLLWSELAWHHKLVKTSPTNLARLNAEIPPGLRLVSQSSLGDYQHFTQQALLDSAEMLDATLVLGCESLEQTPGIWKRYNSVACVDPLRHSIEIYDKQRLVPWGEFVPFAASLPRGVDVNYAIGTTQPIFQVRCRETAGLARDFNFSVSICYDLCFSRPFHRSNENVEITEVDFFAHCGSEGQDPTGALAEVLLKTAQLRAIENRRAIVRNVNCGYSGAIDGNGQILHKTEREPIQQPVTLLPLPIDRRTSLFRFWGDWPLGVVCAAAALTCYRKKTQAYGE